MASPQQFCVKWNSYSTNLQSVFPRLLTSEHFVDITLACEGQMIKCHKVVLSACSTYFEQLLVTNPCPHPIIFMKDMRHWEVQALVDFMYKGEVNVSQDELNALLIAAEALQIRGLCGSEPAPNGVEPPALPKGTTVQHDRRGGQKRRREEAAEGGRQGGKTKREGEGEEEEARIKEESQDSERGFSPDAEQDTQPDYDPQDDGDGNPEDALTMAGPSGVARGRDVQPPRDKAATDLVAFMASQSSMFPSLVEPGGGPSVRFYPRVTTQAGSAISRVRRSDHELIQAANCVHMGMTFQKASDRYHIPISTIRFFMARRGILPQRRRGRTSLYQPDNTATAVDTRQKQYQPDTAVTAVVETRQKQCQPDNATTAGVETRQKQYQPDAATTAAVDTRHDQHGVDTRHEAAVERDAK